jgi:hypothetical protein
VAIESYVAETEFIFSKWNYNEVEKFTVLVNENLIRLSKNPNIGVYNKKFKQYYLVISKQTTLFYNFTIQTKIIELHLFRNNQKNPEELNKLL